MSWLSDLLRDYPALSVAQERLALAEERHAETDRQNGILELEVKTLREQVSELEGELDQLRSGDPLEGPAELKSVLVHLFKNSDSEHCHVAAIGVALGVEKEMAKYFLDKLIEVELVKMTGGNYVTGHTYFGLTPRGRAYVAENGLL